MLLSLPRKPCACGDRNQAAVWGAARSADLEDLGPDPHEPQEPPGLVLDSASSLHPLPATGRL